MKLFRVLPVTQKSSILVPVPKLDRPDATESTNVRLRASVTVLSEIFIEKLAAAQLIPYLHTKNLLSTFHSGVLKDHST